MYAIAFSGSLIITCRKSFKNTKTLPRLLIFLFQNSLNSKHVSENVLYTNTRHVCTFTRLNAFVMMIPNIVTIFKNFDICYLLFDLSSTNACRVVSGKVFTYTSMHASVG